MNGALTLILAVVAALALGGLIAALWALARAQSANSSQSAQFDLTARLTEVNDKLKRFEDITAAADRERRDESSGLKEQIGALLQASTGVQEEARKLSVALRGGTRVQGDWGEQTLRNVLEAAGLKARFDFVEQGSIETEEGRRRPDVRVRLPGSAIFVIDAKCSLTAFLEAQNAVEDSFRDAAMLRHAQSVRSHMVALSSKAYWDQFSNERSPDFVAMFVPGDGFLAAALDRLPNLMGESMKQRVLLVTPTTLFALCKAVAYGWRVEEQAANTAQIAALGRELYKRLSVMGEHVTGLGKGLQTAVSKYNSFVGSLEGQVLTQARRFEDLAVDHEARSLAPLEALDSAPRTLSKLAADPPADEPPILTVRAG